MSHTWYSECLAKSQLVFCPWPYYSLAGRFYYHSFSIVRVSLTRVLHDTAAATPCKSGLSAAEAVFGPIIGGRALSSPNAPRQVTVKNVLLMDAVLLYLSLPTKETRIHHNQVTTTCRVGRSE